MPQNQSIRDLVAKMKLIPVRELIEDKKILFCEDSIVRGTQLQDSIQILYEYGAKEVHMRPACPTLIYPCDFLNFSTSRSTLDLAGRKAIVELEGADDKLLSEYAEAGSERNQAMVDKIRQRLLKQSACQKRSYVRIAGMGVVIFRAFLKIHSSSWKTEKKVPEVL
jgi:amidophosphoribosyltransferase